VTALTSLKTFNAMQSNLLEEKFSSAKADILRYVLDDHTFKKHEDTLRTKVFSAAVELHQDMRSSIRQYEVSFGVDVGMDKERKLDSTWTLRDLQKWTSVKKGDPAQRPVICLYPSVDRLPDSHGEKLVVAAPVIVVETPTPVTTQKSRLSGLQRRKTEPNPERMSQRRFSADHSMDYSRGASRTLGIS